VTKRETFITLEPGVEHLEDGVRGWERHLCEKMTQ